MSGLSCFSGGLTAWLQDWISMVGRLLLPELACSDMARVCLHSTALSRTGPPRARKNLLITRQLSKTRECGRRSWQVFSFSLVRFAEHLHFDRQDELFFTGKARSQLGCAGVIMLLLFLKAYTVFSKKYSPGVNIGMKSWFIHAEQVALLGRE